MTNSKLVLQISKADLAVCRLASTDEIPLWALSGKFVSISRTADELSIVCAHSAVPSEIKHEAIWRAFRVQGTLDFGLTGILSSLLQPLAAQKISIFALSTFDTDYILVKKKSVPMAKLALVNAGFQVINE